MEDSVASIDGNLAATYMLIYSFLNGREHRKAAQALKKAVHTVVILKDDTITAEPPLDEIIKQWKVLKSAVPSSSSSSSSDDSNSSTSSSESESSSDSSGSSDSDSDDTDSSDDDPPAKTVSVSVEPTGLASLARHSSTTLTSGSEAAPETGNGPANKVDSTSDEDTSSDDDSDGDDSRKDGPAAKKKGDALPVSSTKALRSRSESESDSDSDSSNDSIPKKITQNRIAKSDKSKTIGKKQSVENMEVHTIKKRRTNEAGASIVTVTATVTETTLAANRDGPAKFHQRGKTPRGANTPFQRIKVDKVNFADDRLKDNTFDRKPGSQNDYGARASRDLIVTRGDDFRKEKNKKKRGSYRGGEITMETNSIKFA